jgi:hypothetical protein
MKLTILMCLLLAGCGMFTDHATFNDNNIKEYKKCKDAGMDSINDGNGEVTCVPPRIAQ